MIGQSPCILNLTEVGARTEMWEASMLVMDISYLPPCSIPCCCALNNYYTEGKPSGHWKHCIQPQPIITGLSNDLWSLIQHSGVSDWSLWLVSEWEIGELDLMPIFCHRLCCTVQSNNWHQKNDHFTWRSLCMLHGCLGFLQEPTVQALFCLSPVSTTPTSGGGCYWHPGTHGMLTYWSE